MSIEITVPSPGESITDVVLGPWQKSNGDWVEKDEPLVEIESDKVTLEVPASESGLLTISAKEGAEVRVGDVIGTIDPNAPRPARSKRAAAQPAADTVEVATETASAVAGESAARATPLARKVAADKGVPLGAIQGTGPSGRIRKSDVLARAEPARGEAAAPPLHPDLAPPGPPGAALISPLKPAERARPIATVPPGTRGVRRERMSRLRQRIAERLVAAQHTAAMLTTFNECDMSEVLRLRALHKDVFLEKHGVGLGFMSFFAKAVISALRAYPVVNAYIDGADIEYHDYVDLSIAVGTPRGLVVPVLRDADRMSFAEIESGIKDLAERARAGTLTLEDMTGGTFTITNGGVYGSLMSTPILNPPQSGILGMHRIAKRAVEDAQNPGAIVLRPMMYLALSYDHRLVDGEQAVRFLVHVKECIEAPERMLLEL